MYFEKKYSLKNVRRIYGLVLILLLSGWPTSVIESKIYFLVKNFALSGIEPAHESDEFIDEISLLECEELEMFFKTDKFIMIKRVKVVKRFVPDEFVLIF
jgi:hypothetical protein